MVTSSMSYMSIIAATLTCVRVTYTTYRKERERGISTVAYYSHKHKTSRVPLLADHSQFSRSSRSSSRARAWAPGTTQQSILDLYTEQREQEIKIPKASRNIRIRHHPGSVQVYCCTYPRKQHGHMDMNVCHSR